MLKQEIPQNCVEVHSKIVLLWMIYGKGCKIASTHREPRATMFGSLSYRDTWIVEKEHH